MGRNYGVEKNTDQAESLSDQNMADLPGARELWTSVLDQVRADVTAEAYDKWLAAIRFVAEVDKDIVIAANDRLTFDRVTSEYLRALRIEWQAQDAKGRRLKFELWSDLKPEIREMVGNPWQTPVIRLQKPVAGQSMTFESLVVGDSNRRAFGLAKRLASGEPIPAGVIVIYGQPGTGKTHMLKSIEVEANKSADDRRIAYLSAEEFMTRFVEGARAGDTAALQAFVKQNELLMIDDLHWIAGKAKTDKAFFGALRAVTSEGGHVIITADAAPGDMVGLSKELSSEIRGAASVEVGFPDQDMRKEIVRRHAELIARSTPNFVLTDAMVDRIVSGVRGPGRELCGVLWSLQLESGYGEYAPTPEMLETVIRRIAGEPRTPSLDDIKRACMDAFSISRNDIESSSKVRTICYPRQIAMYLSRTMTQKSYPQIAAAYKKKDHTTVLHAYRKVTKALKNSDPDMIADIERARTFVFERLAQA